MPLLSPSMEEGTLAKWLKKEGDEIQQGDILAEVETDKATMDLESFESGVLLAVLAGEGARVPVNALIAVVGDKGEEIDLDSYKKKAAESAPAPAAEAPAEPAKAAEPAPTPAASASPAAAPTGPTTGEVMANGGRLKVSPLAKKIARETNTPLLGIVGSGPGGRILKRDILAAGSQASSAMGVRPVGPIGADERVGLSNMRRTIAKRLVESKTQLPHFYLDIEVDAKPLLDLRKTLNDSFAAQDLPVKLSVNDFILKATTEALRAAPALNASWEGDAIRYNGSVHMSFAVAIPDGLITPVIADAHGKNIREISEAAKALAKEAKAGKLKPEQFTGGTFTVSNLGMFGIDRFNAIINPPQAAILAVGATVKKPVVNANEEIVIGHRMTLTLSTDHRVADGAAGALFLSELRRLIENPVLLVV